MNEYSVALTAIMVAVSGIGAVYRIRALLPVARKRERLASLAKIVARESVEELLMVIPVRNTNNLSNTADLPAEYASRSVLSPFGDW